MTNPNANPFAAFGLSGFGTPNALGENASANMFNSGVDFMRNFWSSATSSPQLQGMASFVTPTLNVEELDRRIKDLKSVESWLAANAAMLRATVQTLEVQRNTIAAIKSFGAAMSGEASETPATSNLPPGWPMNTPSAAPSERRAQTDESPSPKAPPKPAETADNAGTTDTTGTSSPPLGASAAANVGAAIASQAANASLQNAAAWWNLLQDQFAKVASQAMVEPKASDEEPGVETHAGGSVEVRGDVSPAEPPAPVPEAEQAAAKKRTPRAAKPKSNS
ncbi:MAG TPA: PhaM family polyhydroxyalkanoate granule multifunctional regulatory protein [Burkholderiaceae bacterium]|nr:PhaM family polyhydroxyalkanoate granule multifunctional regulatory protein [Burkholderiaceae bacterium]